MAKFNATKERTITKNLAGGKAYKESAKLEIASILMTSMLSDKYYESADTTMDRLSKLFLNLEDKKFFAKASLYARDKGHMRSVSHFCSAILAENIHGEEWLKNYFDKVVMRTDDITETIACYWKNGKKPIPNAMKKGFGKAFSRMDEYQLAKYQAKNKDVSLIDAVRLIHPRVSEKNATGLEKLVKGTLTNTETWNAKLSSACKNKTVEEKLEVKKETWKEFVNKDSKMIESFALLRNFRNIWETNDEETRNKAIQHLTTPEVIYRSKILPFRFYTAYKELKNIGDARVLRALSKAADIALDNVPSFDGKTAILVDVSGSMSGKPSEIAALFGAALFKKNNADVILFDGKAEYFKANPEDSLFTLAETMPFNGGWTDFSCAIRRLGNVRYDRIIILTDMQSWVDGTPSPWMTTCANKEFNAYKNRVNPECKLFTFDLQGYGTLQFPETNVFCLAGFSEKTFDVLQKLDNGVSTLIQEIEQIRLD